ncbi:hypothetical protein EJB05_25917 [Eragrostis curvula]|uniref:Uncharacterized protein n=1 Tax=Eragrostis curvula TaxID=38414 RepID=A0A5J9UIG6_9POAL|nr:hypothetical protein EJB05_25917 [Eragrostis curvula]
MAAAAAAAATVFLETSLGTRLVVSFPASATTVADLKRRVSAEHVACFPQIGPIAVKSLQVKYDGALFYLTDSMAVDSAFRWVKGPWQLRAEAHELQSHRLAREDADGGSGDSEQNAGNHVARASTQNTSSPASSQGGGNLAVGDGVSGHRLLKNQLDEPHDGVECASDQLKSEDTAPQESSDLYLAAGGSDTPAMEQQDQSYDGVEHASVQGRYGNVKKTMLMGSSDFYVAAVGSDNPVDLQNKSREGVKHASGQHKDGNVMTMLQESSDLVAAGENDTRAKNQLDKSHEDVEHASSLCENGNAKTLLQESSDLGVAAGVGETPSMNQQEDSYEGVKHALGQQKKENVEAMLQEKSENDVAAGESETSPMNQLDKSCEGVKHASWQHEDGNVIIILDESSDSDVAGSESETLPVNQLGTSHEDVRHASGQREDEAVNIMLQKRSDLDELAADKDNGPMQGQQKDAVAEPTGAKCFRKEDKNDENTIANCDANISSLASSKVTKLAEEKSSRIEQENLNSSHGMGEKPSLSQKEPWTSDVCNGESSNNGSDIPLLIGSMGRDNSSNGEMKAHRGDEEEPWMAGLCSGETSFKRTNDPRCTRSMKKGKKRPASSDQFLEKRKHEGATSTVSTEQETVSTEQKTSFKRRQNVVTVRKVSMSRAAKIFGFSTTVNESCVKRSVQRAGKSECSGVKMGLPGLFAQDRVTEEAAEKREGNDTKELNSL